MHFGGREGGPSQVQQNKAFNLNKFIFFSGKHKKRTIDKRYTFIDLT